MNSEAPKFLPEDTNGRVACLLIGLFFGAIGFTLLGLFIAKPGKILGAFVMLECALIAALFGTSLVLWALFQSEWIRRATDKIVKHLIWLLFILFIPFAVRAMITLMAGEV